MRHGKKFNHLSRTAPHRNAMLSNMASSLILHKRISTTLAKAKELRKYVEPLITKSKNDTTHSRRMVFSYLQNKYSVKTLFDEVAAKISDRPGGYTRIIKLESRLGDNANMCIIELVDFNEILLAEAEPAKAKTRRSRRGSSKAAAGTTTKATETEAKVAETKAVEEEAKAETPEVKAEAAPEQAEAAKSEEQKSEGADGADEPKEDSEK